MSAFLRAVMGALSLCPATSQWSSRQLSGEPPPWCVILAVALTTAQLAFLQASQRLSPQAPGVGAHRLVTQPRRAALEKTWHPAQSAVTRQVVRVEVSAKEKGGRNKESKVKVYRVQIGVSISVQVKDKVKLKTYFSI